MTITLSYNDVAFSFGSLQQKTLDACAPLRAAWAEADSAQRADLKARWMLNHVAGGLSVSKAVSKEAALVMAAKILAAGKGGNATEDNVRRIDRAYSALRDNVICPKKPVSSKPAPVPARVKQLACSMAEQAVAAGLTKPEFNALISALKKSVTFE